MQVKVRDMMFKFNGEDDKVVVTIESEDTDISSAILTEYTGRVVRAKNTVAGVVDRVTADIIVKRLDEEGKTKVSV